MSAENDVFDRNIETKENVQGDNPKHTMNDKLSVLIQLEPKQLKQTYQTIVQIYEAHADQQVGIGLFEGE